MVEFHDGDTELVDLLHVRYCLSIALWAGRRHCVCYNMALCLCSACAASSHGSSAAVPELKAPCYEYPVSCRWALL